MEPVTIANNELTYKPFGLNSLPGKSSQSNDSKEQRGEGGGSLIGNICKAAD